MCALADFHNNLLFARHYFPSFLLKKYSQSTHGILSKDQTATFKTIPNNLHETERYTFAVISPSGCSFDIAREENRYYSNRPFVLAIALPYFVRSLYVVSPAAKRREARTMLEVIETKSSTKPAIVNNTSGRKRSSSGGDGDNCSDNNSDILLSAPPTTGLSTPPTQPVYTAATPGGTPNTTKTELSTETTSILPPPPGSSVLTESSTSCTSTSINGDLNNNNPLFLGGFTYPSIVSMSQQQQQPHQQQQQQYPLQDDFPVSRPSRESVLQRLSEALLRRSLQKVRTNENALMSLFLGMFLRRTFSPTFHSLSSRRSISPKEGYNPPMPNS